MIPQKKRSRKSWKTSTSEDSTFLNCRKKWFFRYPEKLQPKIEHHALRFGNAFHGAIADGFRQLLFDYLTSGEISKNISTYIEASQSTAKILINDQTDEILNSGISIDKEKTIVESDENKKLVNSMLELFWTNTEITKSFVPVFIEQKFSVPVLNHQGRAYYTKHVGTFDLVGYDLHWQDLVIIEFKTTKDKPIDYENRIAFDPQIGGYAYALKLLLKAGKVINPIDGLPFDADTPVGRIQYHILRKKIPSEPVLTKVGKLSESQIDTLYPIYERALKATGKEPTKKQQKILKNLKRRGISAFYQVYEHYRNEPDLNDWARQKLATVRLMRQAKRDHSLIVRSQSACTGPATKGCSFRSICINDTNEMREMYFRSGFSHADIYQDADVLDGRPESMKIKPSQSKGDMALTSRKANGGNSETN